MGFGRFRRNPLSGIGTEVAPIRLAADEARGSMRRLLDAMEPVEAERRRLTSLFEQLVEDNARVREVADEASRGASESKWLARLSLILAAASFLVAVLAWLRPVG